MGKAFPRSRPTISSKTAISLIVVSLSFAAAFLLRIFPVKYGFYLDEFDPYFHYYATEVIINDVKSKGISGLLDFFNRVDTKFWYPEGRNFATTTYAGLYYLAATLYLLLTSFGANIPLYDFLVILPAFFGSAMVLPIFLIGRRIGGVGVGALAASLTALIPGYIFRSSIGWYDNEPFALFFGFIGLFFLILVFEERDEKKKLMFSTFAALSVGFANTIWGGARLFNGIAALTFLFIPLLASVNFRSIMVSMFSFTIVEVVVGAIFPKPGIHWFFDPSNLLLYLAIMFNLIFLSIKRRYKRFSTLKTYLISFSIILGGIVLVLLATSTTLSQRYLSVLNPFFRSGSPIVQSVAEHQTTTGLEFLYYYGILIFFAILGGYALLREKKISTTLIALLLLFSLYFSSSFARLQVYASLAIALASAYGIHFTLRRMAKVHAKKGGDVVAHYRTIFALMLILLITTSAWYIWIPSNDRGVQLSCGATILSRERVYDWVETLSWIKENLPKDSVIASWWDYGYWISVMGNRTTLADNATINTTRIERIALMFLSNETQATRIMKELGAKYVLVFITGVKVGEYDIIGRVYSLGGDECKFDWMIAIAGLNRSKFVDENSMPNRYFFNNTLIGKLMPFEFIGYGQFDVAGRLVRITESYDPKSNYFQLPLYRYITKYNENSTPFKLVFKSSAQLHQGVYAQVLIYELAE